MKRTLQSTGVPLIASATTLIATSYGLVRLGYGLVLPDAQASLGLTSAAAGVVGALSSLAYCVAMLVGIGTVVEHGGRVVVAAGLCGTAGSLGIASAPTATLFGVAAVLASAAAGLASPATMHLVATRVPALRRTQAQGVVNAGTGPGLLLAGGLALALAPHWRATWAVVAALTALSALGVTRAARRARPVQASGPPDTPSSWQAPWRDSRLYGVFAAAALFGAGSAAVWTYGRAHLEDTWALSPSASVAAWLALGAGALGSALTAGRVATWDVGVTWVVTVSSTAAATAGLAFAGPPTWVPWVCCVVFGWGFTGATTALVHWSSALSDVSPGQSGAAAFVALVAGQGLGAGTLAALLAGIELPVLIVGAAAVTAASVALGPRGSNRQLRMSLRENSTNAAPSSTTA